MGLPKVHRLKRREDFSRVYQKGSRCKTAHLTLRVLHRSPDRPAANPNFLLPTRIGISISTKVDKRSTVRNRMRRQIQAIFRQLLPQIAPGLDLLVVAHPPAVQCDYSQFLQELKQLLVDAEVLHGYPRGCVL